MAEVVTLLTCVRDVPGLNLGWDTDPDRDFVVFLAPFFNQTTTVYFHILFTSIFNPIT
jgi:hypothetical protein